MEPTSLKAKPLAVLNTLLLYLTGFSLLRIFCY